MLNESCCINFRTIAEITFKMTSELKFVDKIRTCSGVFPILMTANFGACTHRAPWWRHSRKYLNSTCCHKQEKTCSLYSYKCRRSRLRFSAKFRNDDVDFPSTFTWKSVRVCFFSERKTLRSRNNSFVFTLIESIEFKAPYVPSIILFKLKENHDKYFFFAPSRSVFVEKACGGAENTGECGEGSKKT